MKALQIKPGQRIVLDMGYGAHSMDERCTVTKTALTQSLFGRPIVRMQVRRPNGDLMDVIDHDFNQEVQTA